jgi:hypothetical protein
VNLNKKLSIVSVNSFQVDPPLNLLLLEHF